MRLELVGPAALLLQLLVACGGVADSESPGVATGGSSPGRLAGEGLREPSPLTESEEILGASPAACDGALAISAPVARACVLSASCSPAAQPTSLSDCIRLGLPASGALPDCAIGAQSCVEMDACVGKGFYPDPCPPEAQGQICVGSKIVNCGNIPRDFSDCAARGATCAAYSSQGDEKLDAAACVVKPSCTQASTLFTCEGTKRVFCRDGLGFGEDCAARGLACVAAPSGATCALGPAACSTPGVGSCDAGGNGLYCDALGRTLTFACAERGLVCHENPASAYGVECIDPSCSADDSARCFEECDGPMAHLCLAGHRHSIDCRAYGFRACTLETRPEEGDRARCSIATRP